MKTLLRANRFVLHCVAGLAVMFMITGAAALAAGDEEKSPKKIFGRIEYVTSGGDVKVKVVESFADLRVQVVETTADAEGEWEIVESNPDFRVEIVEAFEDFTIEYVDAFPGAK